ncbi:hypothetical protein Lalb_Chr23g0273571 [Lupinus albus]|uniref:Uncharacterized protein n=1 Tax=Lupinus albus TaxID=3870 RepID=A0A6A4NIW5_LUPAL|nr:hypothetical protein Lalb_Chr23g0273571 [Lupinus albus]
MKSCDSKEKNGEVLIPLEQFVVGNEEHLVKGFNEEREFEGFLHMMDVSNCNLKSSPLKNIFTCDLEGDNGVQLDNNFNDKIINENVLLQNNSFETLLGLVKQVESSTFLHPVKVGPNLLSNSFSHTVEKEFFKTSNHIEATVKTCKVDLEGGNMINLLKENPQTSSTQSISSGSLLIRDLIKSTRSVKLVPRKKKKAKELKKKEQKQVFADRNNFCVDLGDVPIINNISLSPSPLMNDELLPHHDVVLNQSVSSSPEVDSNSKTDSTNNAVYLRVAEDMWEIGKKIGIKGKGNDDEVLTKLAELEERDHQRL